MIRVLGLAFMTWFGVSLVVAKDRTFADDVAFLKKHTDVIVLKGENGSAVAVVPKYQARVMTSASDSKSGPGFGWINYDHIASGRLVPHINVFGGEDRFWLSARKADSSRFSLKISVRLTWSIGRPPLPSIA